MLYFYAVATSEINHEKPKATIKAETIAAIHGPGEESLLVFSTSFYAFNLVFIPICTDTSVVSIFFARSAPVTGIF